jgi:uncharacterized protein
MSRPILERALALAAEGEGPLRVQLTGGEPTLVPELIEAAAQAAQKLSRPTRLSLQTNGVNLDRAMVKFLKKLDVEVGLSLDGGPAIQAAQRGQSRAVFQALAALEREKWPFTVTTVVTARNCQDLAEVPLILSQYGMARGLGLDLLVRKGRLGVAAPEPTELAVGARKLREALGFVNARRKKPLTLREMEFLRRARLQGEGAFCLACLGLSLAVTPAGQVYPCGQAAFREESRLGEVFGQGLASSPLGPAASLTLAGPHCQGCFLKGACPGECPSRLSLSQSSGQNPRLTCVLYRALAEPGPGQGLA